MIAPTSVNDLVSVGQLSARLGICPTTVRKMCENGMRHTVLDSGHRRISLRDAREYLGYNTEQETETPPLLFSARVSSRGQARQQGNSDKSSLEHQIQRIEEYATEKYGTEAVERAPRYYRIASGLNHDCPVLSKLIQHILEQRYKGSTLICQDSLRLMRFGNSLFSQICDFGGVKIEFVLEKPDTDDAQTDLTNSILAILTHFTSRISGLRSKAICEIQVEEDTLLTLHRLQQAGYSLRQIQKYCKEHNLKGTKGQKLSVSKIQKLLNESSEILDNIVSDTDIEKTSFETFVEENVRVTHYTKQFITRKDLLARYEKWCEDNNQPRFANNKISQIIRRLGWNKKQNSESVIIYRGVTFK